MSLTPHGHPDWEPMVQGSVLRLGKVWTSFKTGEMTEYIRGLAGCTAEGVEEAVTRLINAKEPLRDRPKPGQVRSMIPSKFWISERSEVTGWWHSDGSFGGDWTGVSAERLAQILGDMRDLRDQLPASDHVTQQRQRFESFLLSLGARDAA